MSALPFSSALIVGVGPGIGASVGRALAGAGLKVGLAARNAWTWEVELRPWVETF